MRELLLAFILALIIGSIINGMQQEKAKEAGMNAPPIPATTGTRRDFPEFNSFASLDTTNFKELVLSSQKPVFIFCYAPNNLSCERMIPLVAALSQEHGDAITVARLNVTENAALSHNYEIDSVPVFLLFSNGSMAANLNGVVSKNNLETLIMPYLNNKTN